MTKTIWKAFKIAVCAAVAVDLGAKALKGLKELCTGAVESVKNAIKN